ncbi:MAG: hypothetical protein L0H31_15375 [Nocardioidaceae bacterium]|nr:hypothetical protein [Nocardioidaceae bacterium]
MSDNHGNTPAAWSAVLIALVGFVIGAIGMAVSPIVWPLFWVGAGIVIACGPLFLILVKLGFHEAGH